MKPPPRVLLLAWNFPPAIGGIESVARHLADGLPRCGHRVFTVARHSPDRSGDPAIARPARPGFPTHLAFAFGAARRRVRNAGADAVVCAGIADAPLAWGLGVRYKIPAVVLAHGSDIARRGWGYQRLARFLFRRAAGIAANSAHTRRLLESAGCAPERIRVIHPGVDADFFTAPGETAAEQARARHRLQGRRVLLTAGRLIRRKGITEMIERVMPALCRRYPDLVYVVAGGDATDSLAHSERLLEPLRARVDALGMSDRVRLLGQVGDAELRELYQAADLFVLPAIPLPGDVEGFGIVLLEAALAGTPAVATRVGGIPEAVEDGRSGILVDPLDWDGLSRSIVGLLEDAAQLRRLGDFARRRVLESFSWPAVVRRYADFIEEVAARPARRPPA